MRIVQLITELRLAGAERVVANLTKALQKRGHELFVISLLPLPGSSTIVDELREATIPVESLNMTKTRCWPMVKLRSRLREIQPHIVHGHLLHANILSRLAVYKNKFNLVNTVHIAEKRRGKQWHFWLDRLTYSLCDRQTCVSHAVRNYHAEKISIPATTMPVIYNGIDRPEQLTDKERDRLRAEWGVRDCSRVIGSVGRLDYQKGYDLLLRKVEKITEYVPDGERWGVIIIGDGAMKNELQQLSGCIGASIKICLPGFRPDAAQCIGAFDVFVMPSRYEGFGLTLIEAMGSGIPILSSDADSLPELMKVYPNGTIVNFLNTQPRELFESLLTLFKAGFSEPLMPFSVDRMVDGYETLYRELT